MQIRGQIRASISQEASHSSAQKTAAKHNCGMYRSIQQEVVYESGVISMTVPVQPPDELVMELRS